MKLRMFALVGAVLLISACSHHADIDDEVPQQATAAHIMPVHMQNLATTQCQSVGGSLAYSRQLDGSRLGMCQLTNGKRCSEAALISGDCAR